MTTLTMVPFFTDDLAIRPHTATSALHIGRKLSVKRFSNGGRISVSRIEETGEYLFQGMGGVFAQGPLVRDKK